MKVTKIELGKDKNGNDMKVTTFENNAKVWVNSKYDKSSYTKVELGAEFEIAKDGDFWKIQDSVSQTPQTVDMRAELTLIGTKLNHIEEMLVKLVKKELGGNSGEYAPDEVNFEPPVEDNPF